MRHTLVLTVLALLLGVEGEKATRKFKPYDILGVGRASSPQEIKQAYKRLVKELHPDKNKAPDANDRSVPEQFRSFGSSSTNIELALSRI
jgi:preprotein translocase subunit Sec63